MDAQSIVLTKSQIIQKTERIAFEILENTFEERKIYIAGIEGNGYVFAQRLLEQLKQHGEQEFELFRLKIDKENPLDNDITFSIDGNKLEDKTVILVDDVINSGRTLIYAVRELLTTQLKSLKVATLVNRTHRRFPVRADFVGVNISTTLQDNIQVQFGENELAYLT